MKIAIVIERIESWRGGAETSTMELARLLTQRGHDVHIITTTATASPPDMTVHPIPANKTLGPLRVATFIRRASAFLKENPFDLIHAIAPLPEADVYQPRGGLVGETLRRNVALRASWPRRAMKLALTALSFKKRSLLELESDIFRDGGPLILAVSQYVARQCESLYGVGSPRVRVVFNGVNSDVTPPEERAADREMVRREYNVDGDSLLLLFVAHNFRLKGLEPLITVVSRLVESGFTGFRLLVVGRDNPVRYQRRLNTLKLDRFVTFTGPTRRMVSFFHAADVCLHPTYYDPCSRVVLEALSRGVPCITTSFNGAAEVMCDGREGFVIDTPDAVDEWVRRIKDLRSADLRRKMSAAALSLRDRISMSRHVAELDAVFSEIAGRHDG
ncbi:MAG: glycosyltransferase family 4 protein [Planctomycetota bacterium]